MTSLVSSAVFSSFCALFHQTDAKAFVTDHVSISIPSFLTPRQFLAHVLGSIHFSWYVDVFRTKLSHTADSKFFLASLPQNLRTPILHALDIPDTNICLSAAATTAFHNSWLEIFTATNILPKPWCPENPLSFLLHFSYKDLVAFCQLLSMRDLARELPQVIDSRILKSIYATLDENEHSELKHCLKSVDRLPFPPLELPQYDGNAPILKAKLQKRGLSRLALALHSESEHLYWHILHTLDVARAQFMLLQQKTAAAPTYCQMAQKHVLDLQPRFEAEHMKARL